MPHPVNEEKHNRRGLFLLVSFVTAGLCSLYPVMCFKAHSSREKAKINSKVAKVERQARANEEEMSHPYPSKRHQSRSPARTARMPGRPRRHSSGQHPGRHTRYLRRYSEDDNDSDNDKKTMYPRQHNRGSHYSHDYDRDIDRDRRHRHHGHAPPRRYHHSS